MKNIQKRFLLFLIGCIGVRSLFAVLAAYIPLKLLPYLGYLALIIATGFIYIFITGSRQTGAEVFGDKIWWNKLRPVHATLYLLFAYNAIMGNRNAWQFLALDVVIGLTAFLTFHYMNGDFRRL